MGSYAPFARIVARYLAGALVALGVVGDGEALAFAEHPDTLIVIGAVLGLIVEAAYAFARRKGWAT